MSFVVFQLAALLTLLVVVVCAGTFCARFLALSDPYLRLAWAAPFGLAALGHILLGLALCGWLRVSTVLALIVAALVLGGRDALLLARLAGDAWHRLRRGQRAIGLGLGLLGLAPLVVAALYPPHAWDETIYHLPMARAFAASGGVPFVELIRTPVFPALAELLDAAMLLVADDVATHALALVSTLALGGLLIGLARAWRLGAAGWIAAAMHLGTPIVVYLSGLAYVDPLLTLFVTAGLGAWGQALAGGSRRWLLVAGAFVGSAAAVKYLALYVAGWLVIEIFVRWRGSWRSRGLAVTLYALGAGAAAIPTYARIVYWTGNPLFPFYPSLFGSSAWTFDPATHPAGLLTHLRDSVLLAWRSVFARELVGGQPPLSPFWLIAAVALCLGIRRQRALAWTAGMVAVYTLIVPPIGRYLLPMLPIVGLLGTAVLISRRALSRRFALALCLGLVIPGWLYANLLCVRRGPVPTTLASRRAFLLGTLPGYGTVDFLNQRAGSRYVAYGLHLEPLIYHSAGVWMGDWSGPARFDRIMDLLSDRPRLEMALRALGAQYFAAPRSSLPRGFQIGPGGHPIFDRDGYVVFALDAGAGEHRQ